MTEAKDKAELAIRLAGKIRRDMRPLMAKLTDNLANRGPEVQGAILAELVSIWLAGHDPLLRPGTLADWLVAVGKLVEVNEAILFEGRGHPGRKPEGPRQ